MTTTPPDTFVARMTTEDINAAVTEVRESEWLSVTTMCPVAQVLKRMYPEYRWCVGYCEVTSYDSNDVTVEYRLDSETAAWITNLPSTSKWKDARPVPTEISVAKVQKS